MCRWKPILIFQKGRTKFKQTIQDYVESDQREKHTMTGQQGLPAIQKFIEHFTNPEMLYAIPSAVVEQALGLQNTCRSFIASKLILNLTT